MEPSTDSTTRRPDGTEDPTVTVPAADPPAGGPAPAGEPAAVAEPPTVREPAAAIAHPWAAVPASPASTGGGAAVPPPPGPWAFDPPLAPPAPPRSAFTLRRSRSDRMLGGVCGGLAASVGVDAALLRIALVVLTVFGFGLGAVAYLAAWYLAPEEGAAS